MAGRRKAIAQRLAHALDQWQRRVLEIRPGDPLAARFAAFGSGSRICYPWLEMSGPESISIGRNVHVRSYGSFEAISTTDKIVLRIGDRAHIGHFVRFVALNGIELDPDVAVGHGSTITDTVHDYKSADEGTGLWQTPLKLGRPLRIESGAWIGNNCVMSGGLTVGARAIVGPNSVITRDVPAETIVGGNPPRPLRHKTAKGWEWLVDPATLELDVHKAAAERQG